MCVSQVALLNNGRQFCGGSLMDATHILTAAHCVAQLVAVYNCMSLPSLIDQNVLLILQHVVVGCCSFGSGACYAHPEAYRSSGSEEESSTRNPSQGIRFTHTGQFCLCIYQIALKGDKNVIPVAISSTTTLPS